MSINQKVIAACLGSVILSLIIVGVVSGTLIRHIIQIVPVIFALITVRRKSIWGVYAALPIFVLWLFIMTLIWLFLLGMASVVRGHFTVVEIILTLLIGASSILGIVAVIRDRTHVEFKISVSVFVLFSALQVVAMWISFKRPFVNI